MSELTKIQMEPWTVDTSGKLIVSDPSYVRSDSNSRLSANLHPVVQGEWHAYITRGIKTGYEFWGERNYNIVVYKEGVDVNDSDWTKHQSVSVDSGQICIMNYDKYPQGNRGTEEFDEFYDNCCLDSGYFASKILEFDETNQCSETVGIIVSSGIGDGKYDLYIHTDKNDMIDAIKIEFIGEYNRELLEQLEKQFKNTM